MVARQGSPHFSSVLVNATFHRPLAVMLEPSQWHVSGEHTGLFNLQIQYRPDGNWQLYLGVHVPKSLQTALAEGDIEGLHLETLEVNSLTSRKLPGAPRYLVMGVRARGGNDLQEVPAQLVAARRFNYILGAVACTAGISLLWSPFAWAGAALAVLGSHRLRSARQIPARPFLVTSEIA